MKEDLTRRSDVRSKYNLLTTGVIICGLVLGASPVGAQDMQVQSFLTTDCVLFDHNSITGDDRGGIALSSSGVFYTGDSDTGRFPLDLSSGLGAGFRYDGLVSDLEAGIVYSLADGTTPLQNFTYGVTTTVNNLLEVNPADGTLTGASIALSSTVELLGSSTGIFSGYGRIVLWDHRSPGAIYDIAMPSGTVTVLPGITYGYPYYPQYCEMGAFWGVVESVAGSLSLLYVNGYSYYDTITRRDVSSGAGSTAATFTDVSDTCSLTVDPAANRWYFDFEGNSQFGGTIETIAYCSAQVATSGSADLIANSSGPDLEVALGASLSITVQVDNAGPDDATGVTLSIMVPGILEVVTATPSQGSCSSLCGETVFCDIGSVNAGSMATVALSVAGAIEGDTHISFTAGGDQIDPNLGDNSDSRNVTVTTTGNRELLTLDGRDGPGQVDLAMRTPDFSIVLGGVRVNLPGEEVFAGNGLAADPATGELYAILSLDSQYSTRMLATIDPRSGVATSIGETGDRFSALAINDVGTLYGLTGQGAATQETLYELNRATGVPTLVGSLANGASGEALAFNHDDLLLYHHGGPNHFESVALPGPIQTLIPMCRPLPGSSVRASTHIQGDSLLVATNNGVRRLDADGTHQSLSSNYPYIKGVALLESTEADLTVALTDDVDPVTEGETFTYTATISNGGPNPIDNLGFADPLPGQVVGLSATPSQGSCSLNCDQVLCELGTVASGGMVSVGIEVQTVMAGTATNTVSYSPFGDPDPSSNQDTETTTITEVAPPGQRYSELISLYSWGPDIRRVSTETFQTLETIPITLAGSTAYYGNGLARHPVTGEFWAILGLSGQTGRELVTVNPLTGVASSVGDTGDYIAGLAFDGAGVLYGLTGNGGSNPRQLFTLDQTDGTPTLFLDISAGTQAWSGVGLAYHPEDGMLYVTTGNQVLAVDPTGPSFAPVDLCRTLSYFYANAATSMDATSLLLTNDWGNLFRLDVATGIGGIVGNLDHPSKGLVLIDPSLIFADGFESGDTTAWSGP
jgi:uncharacterized repeat protein (TIGR01451 family)